MLTLWSGGGVRGGRAVAPPPTSRAPQQPRRPARASSGQFVCSLDSSRPPRQQHHNNATHLALDIAQLVGDRRAAACGVDRGPRLRRQPLHRQVLAPVDGVEEGGGEEAERLELGDELDDVALREAGLRGSRGWGLAATFRPSCLCPIRRIAGGRPRPRMPRCAAARAPSPAPPAPSAAGRRGHPGRRPWWSAGRRARDGREGDESARAQDCALTLERLQCGPPPNHPAASQIFVADHAPPRRRCELGRGGERGGVRGADARAATGSAAASVNKPIRQIPAARRVPASASRRAVPRMVPRCRSVTLALGRLCRGFGCEN